VAASPAEGAVGLAAAAMGRVEAVGPAAAMGRVEAVEAPVAVGWRRSYRQPS